MSDSHFERLKLEEKTAVLIIKEAGRNQRWSEQSLLPVRRIEQRFRSCPASISVTILTELSHLQVCLVRLSYSVFPSTSFVFQFQFNGSLCNENL